MDLRLDLSSSEDSLSSSALFLRRCSFSRVSFAAAQALRAALAVTIGAAIYLPIPFLRPQGWLLLYWAFLFGSERFPLASFVALAPGVVVVVVLSFITSSICFAYISVGVWNVLTAALIFISSSIRLWMYFPSIAHPSFIVGPFMFISYANAVSNSTVAATLNPVIDLAAPMSSNLLFSMAITLGLALVPPLFAFFVVRHKFARICKTAEFLFREPVDRKALFSVLLHERREIDAVIEMIEPLKLELFWCNVEGFRTRVLLLRDVFGYFEAMVDRGDVLANLEICTTLPRLRGVVSKVSDNLTEPPVLPEIAAPRNVHLHAIQTRLFLFDGWTQPLVVMWDWAFLMSRIKTLHRGLAFGKTHFRSVREYVSEIEFKFRVANMLVGSTAITIASLFVLIPWVRTAFYNPTWPAISVGALWSFEPFPDMSSVLDRLLGIVVAGCPYYGIVVMTGLQQGWAIAVIGIGFVFLAVFLFPSRRGLQKSCVLVIVLLMVDAPQGQNMAIWLFERLLLNFLGAILVLLGRIVLWILFAPAYVFFTYVERVLKDLLVMVESTPGGSKPSRLEWHRKALHLASISIETTPSFFMEELPVVRLQAIVTCLDGVLRALDEAHLCNRAYSKELCVLHLRVSLRLVQSQLQGSISTTDRMGEEDDCHVLGACAALRDATIKAADHYLVRSKALKIMEDK